MKAYRQLAASPEAARAQLAGPIALELLCGTRIRMESGFEICP